jgi:hypothetical protein
MSVGGSIEEVTIGGHAFSVAADADVTRQLGGFTNAVEMNGDATGRVIKTRTGWSLTGIALSINDFRGDHEFLQTVADGKDADADGFYPVTITYASGLTYQGRGIVTETIEYASQNTTIGVSLAGPGQLTKQ